MENLVDNINKILLTCGIIDSNSQNAKFGDILVSFVTFFLSDFQYKLNVKVIDGEMNRLVNKFLVLLNSKYLINQETTEEEYVTFVLYCFMEYNFIEYYIEYLKNFDKKYINISIENLLNMENEQEHKKYNNIIQSFNRLNFSYKNLKKQTDSFINLSFRLNEIKNIQKKPNK